MKTPLRRACRGPPSTNVGLLPEAKLPAYISWEQYEQNQRQLELNDNATRGVPRKGATLLAGLVLCGRCGHRMQVSYNSGYARYACV